MAGRLTPLFRMLAESWPATVPLPRLVGDLGPEVVSEAQRLGLVRRRPLEPGMAYPCRSFCTMRLIEEDDGLIAVCEHARPRCPEERIDENEAFLIDFDVESVAPTLQRLLGLDPAPYGTEGSKTVLGTRRIRGCWVRFVLVPRPTTAIAHGWIDRAAREEPDRVLVILTFSTAKIPADAPRRIDGTRVEWLGLDEALTDDGIDLADVWSSLGGRVPAAGDVPSHAFVVDEARGTYTYGGHRLALDRSPLATRLLCVLLRDADAWVSRNALLVALYPDEFEDGKRRDYVRLDRRLRQVKSLLSAAFKQLPALPGLVDDPIEVLRTKSDTDGGYRVHIDPERVLILS